MIYCPNCGTANRDGSSHCSECEEELGPAATEGTATPMAEPDEEMPAWLRALGATGPASDQPAESEPQEAESEIPDWLQDLRASLPEEPEGEQDRREEEEPDWLAAFRSPVQQEESEAVSETREEEPGWLAELRSMGVDKESEKDLEPEEDQPPDSLTELVQPAEEKAEPAFEGEEEEPSDWLAELRSSGVDEESKEDLEPEEDQLPDWLTEFSRTAEEKGELPSEDEEDETPDWLAELRLAAEEEPGSIPGGEEEDALDSGVEFEPSMIEEELGVGVEGEEEKVSEELAPEQPPATEDQAEIPAWLAAFQADTLPEGPPPEEESLAEVEGPDWLVPAQPTAEEQESLAQAEIPGWLMALKPAELRDEEGVLSPEDEAPVDATGILAGLQGTLPVEMIIAQPRAVTLAEAAETPLTVTPEARLFAEVVGHPPAAAPKDLVRAPKRVRDLVPRWLIYVALIAAVALPLLLGEAVLPYAAAPTAATEDLYHALEDLDSGAPVLVAFDYDPTTSAEMDLLARALIGHLMDRGAYIVTISLLPAGPATAQFVFDQLAAERAGYVDSYGQRYANLGYLPGQATAVRLLGLSLETAVPRDLYGTPLSELAVMEGLASTQSFDLVLELAAAQDTLRTWIEQASTPYGVELGAGVSASVEPLARPYYETEPRQVVGMVGGVVGAAAYNALLSGQDGPPDSAAARLNSLSLGILALVLILLIGNIVFLVQRGGRRQR